jgi:hypothetical protein
MTPNLTLHNLTCNRLQQRKPAIVTEKDQLLMSEDSAIANCDLIGQEVSDRSRTLLLEFALLLTPPPDNEDSRYSDKFHQRAETP